MSDITNWLETTSIDSTTKILLNSGETVSVATLANLIANLLIKFDISPSAQESHLTYSQPAIQSLVANARAIDLKQILPVVTNLVNNFYPSPTVMPSAPTGGAYMSVLVNPFQTETINLGDRGNATNPFSPAKWGDLLGNFVDGSNTDLGSPEVGYTSGGFTAGSLVVTNTPIVAGITSPSTPYYTTPTPTTFGYITIPRSGYYELTLILSAGVAVNPLVPVTSNIGGDFWLHGFRGNSNSLAYLYRQALMMSPSPNTSGVNSIKGPFTFTLNFYAMQGDKITLSLVNAFNYTPPAPTDTPVYTSTYFVCRGRNLAQVSDYTNVSNEFLKIKLISD